MSYDTAEDSIDSSEPVELFEFTVYGVVRRYTSADRDIVFQSQLWVHHESLRRSDIEDDGRVDGAFIDLHAREDFEISQLYDPYPPEEAVSLRVIRLQPVEEESRTVWVGRVASAAWPQIGFSQLRCEHYLTSFNRPGLRRKVTRNCQHALYGPECKADPAPHTQPLTITSVDGRRIVSAELDALPDAWASGGMLIWEFPTGKINRRGLWNHIGDHADLTYPIVGLAPGAIVTALRGCDHTYRVSGSTESGDCKVVFDNTANYGGFQNFTGVNPFDPTQPLNP